jgi:hypothetical protein
MGVLPGGWMVFFARPTFLDPGVKKRGISGEIPREKRRERATLRPASYCTVTGMAISPVEP